MDSSATTTTATLRAADSSPAERPIRVLHVVESFSAGVATAIEGYIDHSRSDELEHVVVGYRRPAIQIGDQVATKARFLAMPDGKLGQLRFASKAIRDEEPDVIHLHSSWAGLFGRVLPRTLPPIVYTPHAFPFDRRDLSTPAIRSLRMLERALARRTAVLAACSLNEVHSAHALRTLDCITHLPYVLPCRVSERLAGMRPAGRTGGPLEIASVGRLGAQKDVPFFLEVVDDVRRRLADDVRWTWIGGGDAEVEESLRAVGVRVTGWVDQSEVLTELSRADVYLHTAAWEGMPLTILEGLTMGLPVVARDIPALSELGLALSGSTPHKVADHLAKLTAPANYAEAAASSAEILSDRLGGEAYADRLYKVYRQAIGDKQEVGVRSR